MEGTWHFYTDDYRFNGLWRRPFLVPVTGAACAVELNYSTNDGDPRALALWGIYRKRWIARFWQSRGVRILVDLCVSPAFFDLALLGVPDGWRAYAIRGRARDPDFSVEALALARQKAGIADILMVVYGGGEVHRWFCEEHSLIWINDERSLLHGQRWKGGKRPGAGSPQG